MSLKTERMIYGTVVHDTECDIRESKSVAQPKGISMVLCFSVFGTICGTGFMIGFNSGVVNNAAPVLTKYFSEVKLNRTGSAFTSWELTWFWSACVAALPVLAPLGCYLGSRSAKMFGRKRTLMANATLLILSGLLQALSKPAKSYEMFFLGRLVIGLQIGISSTIAPIYISEISPINYRGAFTGMFAWFFTLGLVTSAVLGFEDLLGNEAYWPYLFTLLLLFALIQLVVLSFCPESPRYLLIDRKDREAAAFSLRSLRGNQFNIEEELEHMLKEFRATENLPEFSHLDYFKYPELRKPLILALIAACSIQFSGVSALDMYSEPIFAAVLSSYGITKSHDSRYLVASLPGTRLFVSVFAIVLVDKIGRKKCLLFSLAGLIICNTSLAFLLSDISTAGQTCNGTPVGKAGNVMTLFFFFAHSFSFSAGVSSTGWIIIPELFQTNARPKASFIATSTFWTAYFSISFGFDIVEKAICGWVFLIFATILFIFSLFFWSKLPVLDCKPVNQIASYFENENHSDLSKSSQHAENKNSQECLALLS